MNAEVTECVEALAPAYEAFRGFAEDETKAPGDTDWLLSWAGAVRQLAAELDDERHFPEAHAWPPKRAASADL